MLDGRVGRIRLQARELLDPERQVESGIVADLSEGLFRDPLITFINALQQLEKDVIFVLVEGEVGRSVLSGLDQVKANGPDLDRHPVALGSVRDVQKGVVILRQVRAGTPPRHARR